MKIPSLILTSFLMSSCNLMINHDSKPNAEMLESALTTVSSSIDEQANERNIPKATKTTNQMDGPLCPRTKASRCYGNERKLSLSNCSDGDTLTSGMILLTYNKDNCDFSQANSIVRKNISSYYKKGVRNNILEILTTNSTNYKNETYGNGSLLSSNNDGTYKLSISGVKKKLITEQNMEIYSHNIHTTKDIDVYNEFNPDNLRRAGRVVTGGTIDVDYNQEGITMSISPSELRYVNTCCHPITGDLAIRYSGNKSGTATASFTGECGKLHYQESGQEKTTIELSYCE